MSNGSGEGGGLPPRSLKSSAGIGLPGGRRQVKMPDTVRPDAAPPRAAGGGLPGRREVRHPGQGGSLPGSSTGGGLPAPKGGGSESGGSLPGRGPVVGSSSSQGGSTGNSSPAGSAGSSPSREVVQGSPSGEGLPGRKETNRVPVASSRVNEGNSQEGVSGGSMGGSALSGGVRRRTVEDLPGGSLPGSKSVQKSSPVEDEGVHSVPPVAYVDPEPVTYSEPEPSSEGRGHGGYREPKRQVSLKSPLAGAEDWDDEDVPDTHLGLNAEAPQVKKSRKKAKLALTKRDIEIITLCARYRFAYREQIQHYFQSENVRNRLTRLADEGLLRKDMVTQNQALWLPSQAGLDVADLDLTHIERGRYSATSIAHSIGLLNLGIEFEKGWENLLKEEVWPNFNRVDKAGNRLQGETVITEREITNSFNRLKGIAKGDARKTADVSTELLKLRNDALSEIPAPGKLPLEMREGMAGLFVGYFQNKSHTPDMVIARPRSQDGTSNHIAIELELNPKPIPDWIRILRSFKADPMFKSVIYFTHKRSIMNQLTEVNKKHVGLTPEQFRIAKYTPRNDSIPFWG